MIFLAGLPGYTQGISSVVAPLETPSNSISALFYDYNYDDTAQHLGIDLPAPEFTPVVSPVTGRVITNSTSGSNPFNFYIVIRSDETGNEHVLGHIISDLEVGAPVQQGKAVGFIVTAGTGPHVHWGINRMEVSNALDISSGWGFGRAPLSSSREDAAAKGWLDPRTVFRSAIFQQIEETDWSNDAFGVASLLHTIPCARLAADYNSETGGLVVRGHVESAATGAALLATLRSKFLDVIPISGSLPVIPSPHCDVLKRLETIGLEQSEGQLRDPLFNGTTGNLNTFLYGQGERVIVKMRSPDYQSYVFVDLVDSSGDVLHLRPNQWESLQFHAPDSPLEVGGDREGEASVKLIVGPPYGLDLAIAFSSNYLLYEGLRDTFEPAEPYLDFIENRVEVLKAAHDDFRGEWVFMLLQTHP